MFMAVLAVTLVTKLTVPLKFEDSASAEDSLDRNSFDIFKSFERSFFKGFLIDDVSFF